MAIDEKMRPDLEPVDYPVEKEQLMLKSSFEMYETSLKETEEQMKNKINKETGDRVYTDEDIENRLKLIREAEQDIIDKYIENGGKMEDLKKKTRKKRNPAKLDKTIMDKMDDLVSKNEENSAKAVVEAEKEKVLHEFIPSRPKFDAQTSFDIIPLPSKGECYTPKMDRVPVSYLTAYDENIIISPNLYKENMVIDYILNQKIMNDSIDPSKLLDGDRDAIILYLRAAGYGNEYPITVTDDKTGEEFDAVVDLSELKFKEFNLVGDKDGFFDYELPVTKHKIKFRFLNHQDNKDLQEISKMEQRNAYKEKLEELSEQLEGYIEDLPSLDAQSKIRGRDCVKGIKEISSKLPENEGSAFTHVLTNKLELSIMEVDGNRDRKMIRDFVRNMNVRDSLSLRKYITKNEPGVDFNVTVERPESLGGGSMEVFLEFDQFIFLNVSE